MTFIYTFFFLTAYWGIWTQWAACNTTCGGGIMTRNRTCHFGEAGIDCIGSPSQSQDCNTQPCGKFKLYS